MSPTLMIFSLALPLMSLALGWCIGWALNLRRKNRRLEEQVTNKGMRLDDYRDYVERLEKDLVRLKKELYERDAVTEAEMAQVFRSLGVSADEAVRLSRKPGQAKAS